MGKLVSVAADPPADAVTHDFGDRATSECENRCPASHRLDHHEAERLVPVNWKQEGPGPRQQLILARAVGFADVLDETAIDVRKDLALPVLSKTWLDFAGELQTHSSPPRDLYRDVGAFAGRHPAEERKIVLLPRAEHVVIDRNAVWNDVDLRHLLAPGLSAADGDIVQWILRVEVRQRRLVHMMDGHDDRNVDEPCERHANDVVQMKKVDRPSGIVDGPCRVIVVFELCRHGVGDRPVGMRISPLELAFNSGIAVRVHGYVMALCVEPSSKIRDEQLSAAVLYGWDRNEWRCDQTNSHGSQRE
jgi:hypothetical protein